MGYHFVCFFHSNLRDWKALCVCQTRMNARSESFRPRVQLTRYQPFLFPLRFAFIYLLSPIGMQECEESLPCGLDGRGRVFHASNEDVESDHLRVDDRWTRDETRASERGMPCSLAHRHEDEIPEGSCVRYLHSGRVLTIAGSTERRKDWNFARLLVYPGNCLF